MDKISIKGLRLFAYHGVNPEEKRDGQEFIIDLDYYVDITKACHLDDLSDTVSYAKVVKTVRRVFTAEKYDLIVTGGSDFHGFYNHYPIAIGTNYTPDASLQRILKRKIK